MKRDIRMKGAFKAMEKRMWKTKEIAEEFGVNPSTVQRWVKYFQLPYTSTSQGHFEMDQKTFQKLKHIHLDTKTGKKLRDISFTNTSLSEPSILKGRMVSANQLDERFERLGIQLDHLDRKLQTKADEVVEYQVLQQRKEINELNDLVVQLTERLTSMEQALISKHEVAISMDTEHKPMKKRRLSGIFSL
ncbi:helix-turn-helix domain-containing protein [Salipaludibacillus sp. CF4.18]|uniref:helix-turn-helix domain-containing protein n=1 Tax=Salipaludibacillus sp. CF4.18 TaxID=3373081 RepID=UPI003EE614A5